MLFNSFIADYLRRLFAGSLKAALIMILCFAAVFSTVLIEGFALTDISKMIFGKLLASPAALLCIVLPAVAYKMNQQYLAQNRYGEMWKVNANTTGFLSRLEWSGKDIVSQLAAAEWKLILRNKRTRSVMLLSLLFVGYGLIFTNPEYPLPSTARSCWPLQAPL